MVIAPENDKEIQAATIAALKVELEYLYFSPTDRRQKGWLRLICRCTA